MEYSRIQNYPENSGKLASSELSALVTIWREKRENLEQTGVFCEFIKKMQREWAIETGLIERLYTWDRGVTEVLIERGIDSSLIAHKGGVQQDKAIHIKNIIDDQYSIVENLFAFVKGEQPLTEHYIRGMQAQFTQNQDSTEAMTSDGRTIDVPLEKGTYKSQPNNPRRPDGEMHEYCPPELTQEEMEKLITWYRESETEFAPEVRAAWIHHRFTQIHPFQDGNGRVARALASLVLLKAGLFPLVIRESDRVEYIHSLESADQGDIKYLVDLITRRQKEAILRALGLEQQIKQSGYVDQIISSALEVLKDKYAAEKKKTAKVFEYAEEIFKATQQRLDVISGSLRGKLKTLTPANQRERYDSRLSFADSDSVQKHFFHGEIVSVANKHDYFANLDRYRAWIRLSIHTEEQFEFIVSIHGYGHSDNGIMAVSALTAQRVKNEDDRSEPVNVQPASIDLFQFNYAESLASTKERYSEWLESSLSMALAEWKRQISA